MTLLGTSNDGTKEKQITKSMALPKPVKNRKRFIDDADFADSENLCKEYRSMEMKSPERDLRTRHLTKVITVHKTCCPIAQIAYI